MKILAPSLIVILFLVAPFAARASGPSESLPAGQLVARLGGRDIFWADLDREVAAKPVLTQRLDQAGARMGVAEEIAFDAFESIVLREILVKMALAVADIDREAILRRARQEAAALRAGGLLHDDIERRVFHDLLVDAFVRHATSGLRASEDDVLTLYRSENAKLIERASVVRASHIFFEAPGFACSQADLDARRRAYEVLERARAPGADFSMLARTYSDSNTSRYGGYLGRLRPGRQPPEFDRAAFRLRQGTVSEPVRTENGYNLIWAIERHEPRVPHLAEVRDELRERVLSVKRAEHIEALLAANLRAADLEIFVPGWRL